MFTAKFDPRSVAAVQRALEGVKQGVANRVIKGAVAKQARLVARQAKAAAPRGPTGLVKRSIGSVYKVYKQKQVWVFVIGPRTRFTAVSPTGEKVSAVRVAHLAERGRARVSASAKLLRIPLLKGARKKSVKGFAFVKSVRPAAGTHFIEKAWHSLQGRKQQLSDDILKGIMREAAKYAAKGKSIYG